MAPESANHVNSLVYLVSAIVSPVFGIVVDKVGRNILWVFLAILVTLGAHALLAFTFLTPFVSMVRNSFKMFFVYWCCESREMFRSQKFPAIGV